MWWLLPQEKPLAKVAFLLEYHFQNLIYITMKVKDECMDSIIVHPASGQLLNVKWIDPADYQYLFDNGYQRLFEVEEPESNPDDVISE